MNTMKYFILTVVAAFALTACMAPAGNAPANSNANASNANARANTNSNSAATTAAAPTKDALLAMDKSAYEAWKTKNTGFWDGFLATNFVGFGQVGRMDRSEAMKQYAGTDCDVKSYSMSDEQMTPLGNDAAIISYKLAVDGTCGGQKIPAEQWAASMYVRDGDKWKGAFHAETPAVDPNAPASKAAAPAAKPATAASPAAGTTSDSSMTDSMFAIEKQGWEAWKNRDVNAVQSVMASNFVYFSGTGRKEKADAIKGWSEPKCEGLAYTLSDPKSVSFTKDAALITYNAEVKGSCDGKPIPPHLWVASFDVKEGDAWKNAFYMDSPR
jgi:ketosteroid isomerase-like protein